ncbi:MAG TPA: sodium:solute symporter family protein [Gemmatimonadaceae bacterium]|nr:sodium:solute symporter family protein [Gemmatimonadaceae bacterium]
MHLSAIDWAIVAAYFLLSTGIGLLFTKKGGESLNEYFLSGRNVSWWLAGASMVATTFAADTPLVVTGLVVTKGVAGNWLWWNFVMSGMLTVFFFARLWRRAHVMTDVEFAEVRYSGKRAAALRGFRALYLAIPINLIILGWVTRAMIKILTISLGLRDYVVAGHTISGEVIAVGICFVITVAYSAGAGMWAVLWTDLVQFVIKMSAVIILAVYAVRAVGGMDVMKTKLAAHFGSETAALSVLPVRLAPDGGIQAYAWMPLMALLVFLSVQWWAAWYPGAEPGGGGYVAQRIFSAKTERDGVLATLFFQIAHYALRPWPWIVTGLATVILYPNLQDKESGYVHAFVDLLPTPWRGVMMAGFAAAYMSTVGTQLNWGASYLVNDFYKRFVRRTASEHHYVSVSRWATVALFLASTVVTYYLSSVEQAWKFLLAMGAGTGLVLILRWYWWRINAWSEISAMITSLLVAIVAFRTVPSHYAAGDPNADAAIMLVTVAATTVVWIAVTFLTAPEPDAVLDSFYRRVRPGGPGWARVSERLGFGREQIPGGALAWTNWLAGVVAVYSTLFGIGKLVFGNLVAGLSLLAIAVVAFAWIARSFRDEPAAPESAAVREVEPRAAD